MNLVDELHAVSTALTASGIRYAVCGGVAVTIHGAPRLTKDIDLVIAPGDVQRALEVVRPLGYIFVALPMTFDDGKPKERHVQRVSKIVGNEHLLLDLISADGTLGTALDDSVVLDLPEGRLTVVSRATLLRMKRLADRDQDRADVTALEALDA